MSFSIDDFLPDPSNSPIRLNANESISFSTVFHPTRIGLQRCSIILETNYPQQRTLTINLVGTGEHRDVDPSGATNLWRLNCRQIMGRKCFDLAATSPATSRSFLPTISRITSPFLIRPLDLSVMDTDNCKLRPEALT